MARLVILGSAAIVPDMEHDNTHMVLQGEESVVLIDCGANPIARLQKVGIHYEDLTDIILTHFHPDHVAGVPILLNNMWKLGRRRALRVYGLHHCLNRMEESMLAFSWDEWPNFFPVAFHKILERGNQLLLENADFRITSWPVKHFIPTIGVRVENKRTGFVTAYTCDTAPVPTLIELGRNADLLIHEAAGDEPLGHSTARQAGEIATECGAKRLALIHYEVVGSDGPVDPAPLVAQAQETFDGPVELAEDFKIYEV
ncbi:MAG: MBL fold metallo-hydrolase [Anaerolineae bacterium]|nr:MBL fold metallo-hydrolase [Anaerolineae bacterium]